MQMCFYTTELGGVIRWQKRPKGEDRPQIDAEVSGSSKPEIEGSPG
jgi:hypothetical protein